MQCFVVLLVSVSCSIACTKVYFRTLIQFARLKWRGASCANTDSCMTVNRDNVTQLLNPNYQFLLSKKIFIKFD